MRLYKTYMFRAKDPVIDELRTIAQDATGDRSLSRDTLKGIEETGGPSVSCMQGWFRGKTNRPQSATIEACGRALGYRRKWVKER